MGETLTFHNDPEAKALRIERCKAHMEADRLRAQTYGRENGRFVACAIGCQLYDIAQERGVNWREVNNESVDRHEIVAADYGWPKWLSHLEDGIFEGLPKERRKEWPLRLVSAVPVGKNIEPVRHQLMAWIQREMLPRFYHAEKFPDVAKASFGCATLHERAGNGEAVSSEEWSAAAWSAESAASAAAWSAESAARSAARSAAMSAARSAMSAAESAARSARSAEWSAMSAARSARSAMSAAYIEISEKLTELLEAA